MKENIVFGLSLVALVTVIGSQIYSATAARKSDNIRNAFYKKWGEKLQAAEAQKAAAQTAGE